jgi:hypothetical protein
MRANASFAVVHFGITAEAVVKLGPTGKLYFITVYAE